MNKLLPFFSYIFLFISGSIRSLKILFQTLKLWTDPSLEGDPYLSFDRFQEKKSHETQRKTWINRRWVIN